MPIHSYRKEHDMNIGIVGAGIFGMAAAVELRSREHNVTVFDQGNVPNERASSTDVAKAIRRVNYFPGGPYIELVERASRKWREWHEHMSKSIYYQVGGLTEYRGSEFEPGTGGYESVMYLKDRRKEMELLSLSQARERFPQFVFREAEACFVYDAWAGYLDSGQAVSDLTDLARKEGVQVRENARVLDLQEAPGKAEVRLDKDSIAFDRIVVAAGPWMGRLVPEIGMGLMITQQQMAFFRPENPRIFEHGAMPAWSIHPVEEGWYGFPLLSDGTVKIAMDLHGDAVDPDVERDATPDFIESVKGFVADRMPELAKGQMVGARACLYTNTPDGHFVIDWVPDSGRILVAGGGSGHGFKFGGAIGEVIADALEDKPNPCGDFFKISGRFQTAEQTKE